ncbi:MAG TPA: hypothetical protein VG759_08370 [Candidatus Angelobacter sp.]|jgi:hypothetical protein|nr:hypothetical protein [Candidatus Angelobacter sp.]
MADAGFPLPVSSYKELVKIIQAYGRVGTEASLADVSRLAVMNETTVSGNNGFLLSIAVIQGGKKKSITSLGADLARALEHQESLPEEVASRWRAVVEANDFLQKVIAAVRIRKSMDESSLESHVAYSAGQPRTPTVATGARTVIDILEVAGLLKEEGGNLIPLTPEPRSIPETVEKTLSISDTMPVAESGQVQVIPATRLGGVHLNIDVTVQCTPADLDDLGHKLRKVLRDFNEPEKKPDAPPTAPIPATDPQEG